MKKNEADRLRDIADVLEDHCYYLYYKDEKHSKEAEWFYWGATEIRKLIIDSGFKGGVKHERKV